MTHTCPNCNHPLHREAHYPHEQLYVMESRYPDGSFNVKDLHLVPFQICTENQIYDYYFAKNPVVESGVQEVVRKWYADQGWYWRKKTW